MWQLKHYRHDSDSQDGTESGKIPSAHLVNYVFPKRVTFMKSGEDKSTIVYRIPRFTVLGRAHSPKLNEQQVTDQQKV